MLVITHGKHRMPIFGERTWCPGFMRIKFLFAVFLDLEPQVNATKQVDGLLDMGMIFVINSGIRDDTFCGNLGLTPVIQHIQFIQT